MNIAYEPENKAIAQLLEALECLEAAGYDSWMLDAVTKEDETSPTVEEEWDAREWVVCFHQWLDCNAPTQAEIELVATVLDDLLNFGREYDLLFGQPTPLANVDRSGDIRRQP